VFANKTVFPTKLREKGYSIELLNNPSRTGYTTLDLIERELPVLKASNANFISLLIGVNDQVRGVDVATFRTRFISVLDKVQATKPKARIVVITIPNYSLTPSGARFGNPEKVTGLLEQYNQIITEEAKKKNIPVIDIWSISQRVSETPSLTTEDGLHPSAEQYTLWTGKVLPTTEGLLR
jgi:acyl-CoA thioesterase I